MQLVVSHDFRLLQLPAEQFKRNALFSRIELVGVPVDQQRTRVNSGDVLALQHFSVCLRLTYLHLSGPSIHLDLLDGVRKFRVKSWNAIPILPSNGFGLEDRRIGALDLYQDNEL